MWSTLRVATPLTGRGAGSRHNRVIGIEFPAIFRRGRLLTQRSGDRNCGNPKSVAHG